MASHVVRFYLIALSPSLKDYVRKTCPQGAFKEINTEAEFEGSIDSLTSENCDVMLVGSELGTLFPVECGQLSRQQCGSIPILYATEVAEGFDPKLFQKNGYSQAFLLPMDKVLFEDELKDAELRMGKEGRNYKPVYVMDLDGETELDFSTYVFLPLNNKHIRFSKEKDRINEERLKRLKEKDVGKLMIDKKDMSSFYKYSSARLVNLGQADGSMSETERKEKLNSSVRGLFTNIVDASNADFNKGKELVADCQKIVSLYITGGGSENWYNELVRSLNGANNTYDHAATVSTLAALFAIAIGEPHPEEYAIAGFLHDLGRSHLPDEMPLKPLEEWPEDLRKQYLDHPQHSLNVIKNKKMIIPANVEKAILQHHEMFNGKGFPKQLAGDRICTEAQVLSFADQFFYYTVEIENKRRLSIEEAFQKIKETGSIGPALLKKLHPVLVKTQPETANKPA